MSEIKVSEVIRGAKVSIVLDLDEKGVQAYKNLVKYMEHQVYTYDRGPDSPENELLGLFQESVKEL